MPKLQLNHSNMLLKFSRGDKQKFHRYGRQVYNDLVAWGYLDEVLSPNITVGLVHQAHAIITKKGTNLLTKLNNFLAKVKV